MPVNPRELKGNISYSNERGPKGFLSALKHFSENRTLDLFLPFTDVSHAESQSEGGQAETA